LIAASLSAAGRLWLLVTRPLWHDEVFTVWASRLSPSELIRVLRSDSSPPLFYFLEKPFVAVAEALSLPDAAARVLPFLALAVLFAGARSLPSGAARRRFLWLAASSPLFLLYSAEARAYALLALFGFILFLLVVRNPPGMRGFLAVALAAALCLWTHYLALFLVASLLFAAVRAGRRLCALALVTGFALFLPWSPVLLAQPKAALSWMREPLRTAPLAFLAALGGGVRVPGPFGAPPPEALFWLSCAAGLALFAGLVAARPAHPDERIGLAAIFLTLAGILLVSIWRPVAFPGRSEMAVLPIWILVVARAGERSRALRLAAGAAAAIGVASSLLILAAPRPSRPADAALSRLEAAARPGDLVVATASFYLPARLARDRARLAGELHAFPSDLEEHPGWFLPKAPSDADYRRLSGDIARAGAASSVLLLLDRPYWDERLHRMLLERGPVRPLAALPDWLLVASLARPAGETPPPR
jgi:hypothetical protein